MKDIVPTYGDKHCATLMGPFSAFSIISTLQIAIAKFSFWPLLLVLQTQTTTKIYSSLHIIR